MNAGKFVLRAIGCGCKYKPRVDKLLLLFVVVLLIFKVLLLLLLKICVINVFVVLLIPFLKQLWRYQQKFQFMPG